MKFTTAAVAATAATFVSASPLLGDLNAPKIKDLEVFNVITIRTGSDFQYSKLQAADRSMLINVAAQNASCYPPQNYASFILNKGDLFLYTANPPQQFFVDRSGMGQGVIQYTTGAEPIGRNQERTGWAIDHHNNLVWKDKNGMETGLQACPGVNGGGYGVWLTGVTKPAGLENCVGFTARAVKAVPATQCSYTQG